MVSLYSQIFFCYIEQMKGLVISLCLCTVLSDGRTVFPVSVWDERRRVYIGQPAMVGAAGIVQSIAVPLTEEEQQAFEASAKVIDRAFATLAL